MSKSSYNSKPNSQYQKNREELPPPKPYTDFEVSTLTENGLILRSLISESGEKNVKALSVILSGKGAVKLDSGKVVSDSPLNVNQLRKFYDSFLRIYNLRIPENEKKIKLLMLRANLEYSAGRLKIYRFALMMKNRIDIVIKSNDNNFVENLDALKLHFEALVAYYPKG